jgi:serine phosphatase RsbU (regulator of sigma subunit)
MPQKIINLTCLLVIQEVKDILATYPETPYQEAFAEAELYNQLINQVLSRIPDQSYTILYESEKLPKNPRRFYASMEERMMVEELIHQTIIALLEAQRKKTLQSPASEDNCSANAAMTSNKKIYRWFGY